METFDHVVVGGGAMGAATAWQLAARGHSVALIEQFGVAHNRGSSHGGVRIFRFAYRKPLYARLAVESLAAWRELEAETGEVLLEQIGQLDHGVRGSIDEIERALAGLGRPFERLSPSEAVDRWPGMRFDEHVIFSPDGGRCYADRTVSALYRRFAELGGATYLNTRVEDIEVMGDLATVATSEGTFRTRSVVVAAGAWLRGLVGDSVRLPTFSVDMGQPTHFQPRADFDDPSLWPSFIHHAVEDEHNSVVGGGAYGLWTPGEGFKIGKERPAAESIDPDNRSFDIDRGWLQATQEYAAEWFPGLDTSTATAVTCLFTDMPDADFVMDRQGPLTVVSPCSGHGFKFVPQIGRLAADLASGGTQPVAEWRFRS